MKYLSLLILFVSTLTLAQNNTLTPELLWKLKRVGAPQLSPNKASLLFTIRTYEISENKGNTDLYILNLASNSIKQITDTPFSENDAQWGSDGMIYFMSSEKDGYQIWKIGENGIGKTKVSNFSDREVESFKLSPKGSFFLTVEAVKMEKTINEKYPDLPLAEARVMDDLMYRHWNQWSDYKKRHLVIHPVDGTTPKDIQANEPYDGILPPFGGLENVEICANDKFIYYVSKKLEGKQFAESTNSDIWKYDIETGKTDCFTTGRLGYDTHPSFSLDQTKLAWLSMAKNGFESDKNNIIIHDFATKKEVNLTAEIDLTVEDFIWGAKGKFIYFMAMKEATRQYFSLEIKSKKVRQITEGDHNYTSLTLVGDDLIGTRQSMLVPNDIHKVNIKSGVSTQLTYANKEILDKLDSPKVEKRWIETTDGKKMLTWVILPPNFDENKKYPTLLYCQGGPQSAVSQFYSFRWNFSLMASQGYIIVAPNRRGLPGFGQEWNDAISKDWGGQPMDDYFSAIDEVAKEPYVDNDNLGAVGASYGGYSVYYLAGHHNGRFRTFIAHCGLFNLESWYGTTEELFFANWDIGGPYWKEENKSLYEDNSPHKFVKNWDTPILVIHSEKDFRVPIGEGLQAFQAAQIKGLKSRFLYFPTEGHWVQSPQNGLVWHREFFEWLDTCLKR